MRQPQAFETALIPLKQQSLAKRLHHLMKN
jgi:hypothetical protein